MYTVLFCMSMQSINILYFTMLLNFLWDRYKTLKTCQRIVPDTSQTHRICPIYIGDKNSNLHNVWDMSALS